MFRGRVRGVVSPLGWPVPAVARWADAVEIAGLVGIARSRGYSRKAPGIDLSSDGARFLLTPIFYEATPEASWACVVVRLPSEAGRRVPVGRLETGPRLDVSVRRFAKLRKLRRAEKDWVIHCLMWSLMDG